MKAITYYEAALQVYNRKAFPLDWARTQNSLGNVYSTLMTLEHPYNQLYVNKAISCYRAALLVYILDDMPEEWAIMQNNLGNAYTNLLAGDRQEHLERAISCYEAALQGFLALHLHSYAQDVRENIAKTRAALQPN